MARPAALVTQPLGGALVGMMEHDLGSSCGRAAPTWCGAPLVPLSLGRGGSAGLRYFGAPAGNALRGKESLVCHDIVRGLYAQRTDR